MRVNSRKKILNTARSLFLKYGFNGISLRTIAAKARMTTGAIYFHFKNKKDIYQTICSEGIELLMNMLRAGILQRRTPAQKLISTYDSYISFYNEYPEYYNILMESRSDYADQKVGYPEFTEKLCELIRLTGEPAKMAVEAGDYREIDPQMLGLFLASLTEGMLQYKKLGIFDELGINDSQFRQFMADIVGHGVLNKTRQEKHNV